MHDATAGSLNHPAAAPAVKVRISRERYVYLGTADALIAAGLAQPEWIPGSSPMCPRKRAFHLNVGERRFIVFTRSKNIAVYCRFNDQEYDRYSALFECDEATDSMREQSAEVRCTDLPASKIAPWAAQCGPIFLRQGRWRLVGKQLETLPR